MQTFEFAKEPNCLACMEAEISAASNDNEVTIGKGIKREPLEASGKGKSISVVILCFSWRASEAMHADSGKNLPLKNLTIIICLMAKCNSHSRKGQHHLWVSGPTFWVDY